MDSRDLHISPHFMQSQSLPPNRGGTPSDLADAFVVVGAPSHGGGATR